MQPEADLAQATNIAIQAAQNMPTAPSRMRVQHADTSLELEWETAPTTAAPQVTPAAPVAPTEVTAPHAVAPQPVQPPEPVSDQEIHHVCSPIVGAFYRSPKPGAAPFIEEGSTVNVGQQVAIVEAMKLMVPVDADQVGTVVAILKKDGEFVEYGEPLYTLALCEQPT